MRKLNLYIAKFAYGGTSGFPHYSAAVGDWLDKLIPTLRDDQRIGTVVSKSINLSPLSCARNAAVTMAREVGADLILMIDSDSFPDQYLGKDPRAVPFWNTAFDAICAHYERGPILVSAPYCTAPPDEEVPVMHWASRQSDNPNIDAHLVRYTREEAAVLTGLQSCAAGVVGLSLIDMRLFDLVEPKCQIDETIKELYAYWINRLGGADSDLLVNQGTLKAIIDQAARAKIRKEQPWFYFEYKDATESEIISTEDVTFTRDVTFVCRAKYGYSPMYCAWDSWCGHLKSKLVGRPAFLTPDVISDKVLRLVRENVPDAAYRLAEVNGES